MTQYTAEMPYSTTPRVDMSDLMRNVYLWMFMGMLVTAGMTVLTINVPALFSLASNSWIVLGTFIVQLLLVGSLVVAVQRMSTGMAILLFLGYAASVGFTLTMVLLYYSVGTITMAFTTAAALFLAMSIVGMTTSMDLTKWSTYLFMGLIGLMIAMVLNVFLFQSSTFDLILSIGGVILFTALTAYDTQKIKRMASNPEIQAGGGALLTKLSILGALALYLDFLNLFLFLLRIFGRD